MFLGLSLHLPPDVLLEQNNWFIEYKAELVCFHTSSLVVISHKTPLTVNSEETTSSCHATKSTTDVLVGAGSLHWAPAAPHLTPGGRTGYIGHEKAGSPVLSGPPQSHVRRDWHSVDIQACKRFWPGLTHVWSDRYPFHWCSLVPPWFLLLLNPHRWARSPESIAAKKNIIIDRVGTAR